MNITLRRKDLYQVVLHRPLELARLFGSGLAYLRLVKAFALRAPSRRVAVFRFDRVHIRQLGESVMGMGNMIVPG
jgi:hypothetical protein